VEYPSAAFLDAATLFVSDGHGLLYALRIPLSGSVTILNSFELKIPPTYGSARNSVPFRIHTVASTSSHACLVVLSSKYYKNATETEAKSRKPASKYDIWAVSVDIGQIPQDQPLGLEIVWHRRGDDVPLQVTYLEQMSSFMLLGRSSYRSIMEPTPVAYEPTSDELAPIPRAGENLDNLPTAQQPPPPPPYSWTQTEDSVTVAFPIPSSTPKEAIKVTFSPTTLSLFVQAAEDTHATTPVPLPRYALTKFWDGIRTDTSFWTLDREGTGAFGLLTLHLDKQHDGTRWAHVFAASGTSAPDALPDVPETLDPSELVLIRESLEKYTAALQTGDDASGLGLGHGMPSLAQGEADDEVDADVGDMTVLTWVAPDGAEPAWATTVGAGAPFTLLSTPLPGHAPSALSLVVKHGMDGLQFALDAQAAGWTHNATFCVLSFVLASKRDTRFVHHLASRAVFAFESGARDLGGNVYIYRPTTKKGDKFAKQAVLKIGDGASGPLLGVGAVVTQSGQEQILCLCERELVIIQCTL
jgi:hypothetical protein